jgi:tripartite-type tricarboxylate transporter receptor subunit TctC
MIIADTPVLLPLVNTNAVRPLALFAAERSPLIPDVATTAELGYPEIVMENWYGVLGPAGLAPSVQANLEKAILEVLASPAIKERFAEGGRQGARDSNGLKARLASDVAYWGTAVKGLGISAE